MNTIVNTHLYADVLYVNKHISREKSNITQDRAHSYDNVWSEIYIYKWGMHRLNISHDYLYKIRIH